jgi:hypothetical protein
MPASPARQLFPGKIAIEMRVHSSGNVRVQVVPKSPFGVIQRKPAVNDCPVIITQMQMQFGWIHQKSACHKSPVKKHE